MSGLRYWFRPFTVLKEQGDRVEHKLNEIIITYNDYFEVINGNIDYLYDTILPDISQMYRQLFPRQWQERQDRIRWLMRQDTEHRVPHPPAM